MRVIIWNLKASMENPMLFGLAVLSILATPGPTNTLLATAGAAVGMRRAMRLILAEGTAYLIAILVLRLVLGPVLAGSPTASMVLRVIVGMYLAWVAWRLWDRGRPAAAGGPAPITFGQVFLATLLNPKAIVFAISVVPFGVPHPSLYLIAFSLITAGVAVAWISGGAMLGQVAGAAGKTRLVPRVGAAVVGAFAILLVTLPLLR